MKLSNNFELSEFVISQTAARKGINNTPPPEVIENLKELCVNILEPLRAHVGLPIRISSGYRSPALNAAVGGAKTSQHVFGQACDFTIARMSIPEIIKTIRELNLPFDQVIDEFSSGGHGWCHVSYSPRHRRQVLKIG